MASRALAILALLAIASAHAEDLGTLFFTPAEREHLDQLRRGESVESTPLDTPGARHAITGYVKRSDGRGVVWIDGKPVVVRDPAARGAFDPAEVSAYSRSADEVKIRPSR